MTATTLEARVRLMIGVTSGEIADAQVTEALDRARLLHQDYPMAWEPSIGASPPGKLQYLKASIPNLWGIVRTASDTNGTLALQAGDVTTRIIDGRGTPIQNWTLAEDGNVVFTTDQSAAGTHYITVYGYDLNSAAADLCDWMLATRFTSFDFKVGSADEFTVSQVNDRLVQMAKYFRARALPRSVSRERRDNVRDVRRRHNRSRAGNDL